MAAVGLLASFLLLDAISAASPPPPKGCTDELVSLSPCLGYVSAQPNNVTDAAGPECCDAFSKALGSGVSNCLCYLVREPAILGFPLNQSRVSTLPSACSWNSSLALDPLPLDFLCSGIAALPPLSSITGFAIPKPFVSGPRNIAPPPSPHSPPPQIQRNSTPPQARSPEKPTLAHMPPGQSWLRGHTGSSCRRLSPSALASLCGLVMETVLSSMLH